MGGIADKGDNGMTLIEELQQYIMSQKSGSAK